MNKFIKKLNPRAKLLSLSRLASEPLLKIRKLVAADVRRRTIGATCAIKSASLRRRLQFQNTLSALIALYGMFSFIPVAFSQQGAPGQNGVADARDVAN